MTKVADIFGKAGVYGLLAVTLYDLFESAMETNVGEDVAKCMKNSLFVASDWTPFFNKDRFEQYQAGLNEAKSHENNTDGSPTLTPSSRERKNAGLFDPPFRRDEQGNLQLTVDFRNMLAGTQVQTEGKSPSWFNFNVGYTRFARQ